MAEEKYFWRESMPGPSEAVFNALIAICIRRDANWYEAVGTGFVVGAGSTYARVISAAHVFQQIFNRQNPRAVERYTVFDALHPTVQYLDLDPDRVFGLVFQNGRSYRLQLSELFYEQRSDFAMFKVATIEPGSQPIFNHNIRLDAELPPIGTAIEGIGFKHMGFAPHMDGVSLKTKFQAGLVRRSGTISDLHPKGHMGLKVPCATATFPIFGGMSGGPVLRLNSGRAPAAFGLLSSDFDATEEEKYDYSQRGSTTVAKLPVEWSVDESRGRVLTIQLVSEEIGASKDSNLDL